jgi:predicted dehydrogenase
MMARGALDVGPLVSHRVTFAAAHEAYELLVSGRDALGIVLNYDSGADVGATTIPLEHHSPPNRTSSDGGRESVSVGVIGAGNYAGRVLIPALAGAGANLYGIANTGGVGAAYYAKKHGFREVTTDPSRLIESTSVDAIVVATRHDSHARLVLEAMESGKAIFCEKPLALSLDELGRIRAMHETLEARGQKPLLMVGFNRRFAPAVVAAKRLLEPVTDAMAIAVTVNAGAIPADHWTQDRAIGGGRIIGEACHFVDLIRHLVAAPITRHQCSMMASESGDTAFLQLEFADGSIGSVHYLANGHRRMPKERVEIFLGGRVLVIDNFRRLLAFGWPGRRNSRRRRQDKGQIPCVQAFIESVAGGESSPIPFSELDEVSRVTIELADGL